jgi:hypothetical protein
MPTGFPVVRRLVATIGAAGCAALALAGPASASTIGSTFVGGTLCGANGIFQDPAYSVPGPGHITSFSFQTVTENAGQQADFLVLRGEGGGQFGIVGGTGVKTLDGSNAIDTFSPPRLTLVQAGDTLGIFTATSLTTCGDTPGLVNAVGGQSDPSPGDTVTLNGSFGFNLNESAEFTPSTPLEATSGEPLDLGTLLNGSTYLVTVRGTYSAYKSTLMSGGLRGWVVCGSPEPAPMFGAGGAVGSDAQYVFARPQLHRCDPHYALPHPYGMQHPALLFDTGSGFARIAPDSSGYSPSHTYTYTITGQGQPLQVLLLDTNHTDNYGTLEFDVVPIS